MHTISESTQLVSLGTRLRNGFSYAFGGLLGDIGGWLLIGIGIAGVISFIVPSDFIEHHATGHIKPYLMMLLIGIPLYICATASTPIAAALVLKGLSPGAALVFLLAGPASNASTITVITRLMGKRIAALYLVTIAVCSLVLGLAVDQIYRYFQINVSHWVPTVGETAEHPIAIAASGILLFLILRTYIPRTGGSRASNSRKCAAPEDSSTITPSF
jgi:hypothetical protein